MSLLTVEGIYKRGVINLSEPPSGVDEARVLVTFLPAPQKQSPPRYLTFGQLRGKGDRMSTEEDFKLAEWHPDLEEWDAK